MAWTTKQINDLNRMNRAAQNVSLGTTLSDLGAFDVSTISGEVDAIQAIVPVTAGTAEASKLLQLGATKNVDVIAVADLKLGAGAGTSVTSSAAELNILDGVTSTAAELNILDGVTSTAAELNILDGVTKTFSEINGLVEGVAAGYKIARGTATIGTASDTVVTGLTTVVGAVVSMVGDPSLTHMFSSVTPGDQAGSPAAGSIIIKSWKPTSNLDVTPLAASSPFANVSWIAIGT